MSAAQSVKVTLTFMICGPTRLGCAGWGIERPGTDPEIDTHPFCARFARNATADTSMRRTAQRPAGPTVVGSQERCERSPRMTHAACGPCAKCHPPTIQEMVTACRKPRFRARRRRSAGWHRGRTLMGQRCTTFGRVAGGKANGVAQCKGERVCMCGAIWSCVLAAVPVRVNVQPRQGRPRVCDAGARFLRRLDKSWVRFCV